MDTSFTIAGDPKLSLCLQEFPDLDAPPPETIAITSHTPKPNATSGFQNGDSRRSANNNAAKSNTSSTQPKTTSALPMKSASDTKVGVEQASSSRRSKRGMTSSKSAEKISQQQQQKRLNRPAVPPVIHNGASPLLGTRNSKSQENYLDHERMTMIDIDFEDDIASSVDALTYDDDGDESRAAFKRRHDVADGRTEADDKKLTSARPLNMVTSPPVNR